LGFESLPPNQLAAEWLRSRGVASFERKDEGGVLNELKLISGNSNIPMAKEICDHLGVALGATTVSAFSDGEILVRIEENVRGMDVFVVQSCSDPVNKNIMELLIMIDALKRSSARRITAVIPYFGYARQDRKDQPRVPVTAKLVADLITTAGANKVLTMDLHAGQIQGFFNIPVDHLYATPVILNYLRSMELKDLVVVSPDAGGVERARAFAKRLNANLAIIDKRREGPNQTKIMNIIGDVDNRDVLLLDDMIDTAGTIAQGAQACADKGARRVLAGCSHAVLSGPALQRLNDSVIDQVIVTNTIPMAGKDQVCKKIRVLSVAPLLGEAIRRIHNEESVSSLFV
jgi:ribose-phosphate pyrophosphokinase